MRRLLTFSVIGVVGFAIDSGLMMLFHKLLNVSVFAARPFSFLIAVTVTWWLNRSITFCEISSLSKSSEWRRYVAVNTVGSLINLGVFYFSMLSLEVLVEWPLAALAIGSLVAMFFNFWASQRFAFTGTPWVSQRP